MGIGFSGFLTAEVVVQGNGFRFLPPASRASLGLEFRRKMAEYGFVFDTVYKGLGFRGILGTWSYGLSSFCSSDIDCILGLSFLPKTRLHGLLQVPC